MIDMLDEDAKHVFEAIANEHSIELNVLESAYSSDVVMFSLVSIDRGFIHECCTSYERNMMKNIIWIDIFVQKKDIASFRNKKYANMLDYILMCVHDDDIVFYNANGCHALIKKGTTLEELLMKADLSVV